MGREKEKREVFPISKDSCSGALLKELAAQAERSKAMVDTIKPKPILMVEGAMTALIMKPTAVEYMTAANTIMALYFRAYSGYYDGEYEVNDGGINEVECLKHWRNRGPAATAGLMSKENAHWPSRST